jgi:4-amino-4-deoxy-L-arabinose transferase-like glycosyltransferase
VRERATREQPGAVDSLDYPAQELALRPSIDRFGRWLVLICAVALILRLGIVYQGRHDTLNGDGFVYSAQANWNARGQWFVGIFSAAKPPDALHPPAWTLLLTVWAWLGQHSWYSQQVLAAFVGTLTVGIVALAGRRIAGVRVGLLAAGIAALYPGLWVYERAILSETLLLLGIAVMILLAYRFRAQPSAGLAATLGIVCGILALTRSEQILVFGFLVAPLILAVGHVEWRRRIGWLALAALCVLVVLAPWTIYNLGRFQRPVLLSNNFGSAVAQGNCNITYYGPLTGSYSLGCLTPLPGEASGEQDQSVENSTRLHQGSTYLEHHLGRLPVVMFAREGRAFGFWNPFQQVRLDAEWEGSGPLIGGSSYVPTALWVNRLALFGFWLLLLPAAAGLIVLRRRTIPVYPLLGFFAIVALTVAATYGEPRYRAAIEIPLVLLAAVGIGAALTHERRPPSPEVIGETPPIPSFAPTS